MAAAFHPTLQLAAGGFDRPGTDGFIVLASLFVFHALLIVAVVFKGIVGYFDGGDPGETGLELFQVGDHLGHVVVADLPEQGFNPAAGLRGAGTMEFVGNRPQVGIGVVKVQSLNGIVKAVGNQVPDPDGTVGDDQHLLSLPQASGPAS